MAKTKSKNDDIVLSDEFCKTMSEKTESKSSKFLATQKMIEELQDKTAETIRKDREKMLALTTSIYIDMVEDKTVEGYHKQISNNMMVGIKATYFVCRDLHDAKQSLSEKEFNYLVSLLKEYFSRSTVDKFLAIGESERLSELYSQGRLPFSWTTQYAIATLDEDDWYQASEEITSDITMSELNELTGKVSIPSETWRTSRFDKSRTIGLINVKSQTEDSRLMSQLSDEIRNVIEKFNAKPLSKYETSSNGKDLNDKFEVEFKFDTETMNKIETKTENFIKKMKVGKAKDKKQKIANVKSKGELATA